MSMLSISFDKTVDKLLNDLLQDQERRIDYYQAKIDLTVERTDNSVGYRAYKLYICQAIVHYWSQAYEDVIYDLNKSDEVRGDYAIENKYEHTKTELYAHAHAEIKELQLEYKNFLEVDALKVGAIHALIYAISCFILGGIITGITYSMASPGGTYIVTSGLFLVGGINLLLAIGRTFKWLAQK